MVGNVAPEEFVQEIIIGIAKDRQGLDRILHNPNPVRNYVHTITNNPLVRAKIKPDPQIHVKRYRTNDVIPTMNLDDYDLEKHKQNLKIITTELQKHAHTKKMKDALDDIEAIQYAPPSKVLPKGSVEYREIMADPSFKKRWTPYDKSIK